MMNFPDTNDSLVIRTDYSDAAAWDALCEAIAAPTEDGFQANVRFVSDPSLAGMDIGRIVESWSDRQHRSFVFVADSIALRHPEHPVLVIDLHDGGGRAFRVIPSEAWSVENNLSLGNMDFHEFADSADADGIFRGFHEG